MLFVTLYSNLWFVTFTAVVVQDVAPAETFGSVAAALKALSVTADVIFSRVENRVADERARLAVINARIAGAKARIQSMAGAYRTATS